MNIHNPFLFALTNQGPCHPVIKLIDLIYRGFQFLAIVGRTWQQKKCLSDFISTGDFPVILYFVLVILDFISSLPRLAWD
jgi:hypothetical protein